MTKTALLVLLAAGAALAQDPADGKDLAEFQAKLRETVAKVRPGYVFIGGGSGVCVSPDGWILTNHHVAGGQRNWTVRFTGGKSHRAELVGWHPLDDVAVLKIRDGKDLPFVPLGDSEALKVGDPVIAVGNPFMLGNENWEPTVTFGMVSALNVYLDNPGYKDAVVTDAQINPGNSGGPLITLKGEVIGINGRIEIRRFMNRVNTGIGYAIPSNQIARFLPHFQAGGRQWGGHIDGVTLGECGDDRYENVGEYGDGVFVAGIEEGSPAEKAGLKLGDLLFNLGGRRVYNLNRLHGVAGTYPAGSVIPVRGKRWNAEKKQFEGFETKLLLGKVEQMREYYAQAGNRYYGFLPDYFHEGKGFKVGEVNEGAPGPKAGVKVGDLIVKANGEAVASWTDFRRRMGLLKPGDAVMLTVERDGKEAAVEMKLDQRDLAQDQIGRGRPPRDPKDRKKDMPEDDEDEDSPPKKDPPKEEKKDPKKREE